MGKVEEILVFLAILKSRNASVWTALAGLGTGFLLGKQCFLETLHISANNSEILRNNRELTCARAGYLLVHTNKNYNYIIYE